MGQLCAHGPGLRRGADRVSDVSFKLKCGTHDRVDRRLKVDLLKVRSFAYLFLVRDVTRHDRGRDRAMTVRCGAG